MRKNNTRIWLKWPAQFFLGNEKGCNTLFKKNAWNWEKLEKNPFVLNFFHSYSCTIVWPRLIPSRSRWGSGQERGLSPCRWVWRAAGGSLPLRLTFSSTPSPQNPVFNTWPDALNYSTFSIFHMAPFSMFVALALCNFHGKKNVFVLL